MKSKIKRAISVGMATGIIIGASGITSLVNADSSDNIIKSINNINKKVEVNTDMKIEAGFDIAPDVNTETDEMISVIVELKEDPIALATYKYNKNKMSEKTAKEKIKTNKDQFKKDIKTLSKEKSFGDIEYINEYDTVFNGISIKIKGTSVEKLLQSDQVKSIWNNQEVKIDLPKENEKSRESNNNIQPYMHDSKGNIDVDKLHSEGIKGKGIKVGVIDTGIDYNHPDLKENYKGATSKDKDKSQNEVKGWDFVDNDADPMETTREDWQQSGKPEHSYNGTPYYTSHGTHVSGTVAANGQNDSEFSVVGVAPEADLYGYRVLGAYGSGNMDNVMLGIEKAVKDGMDVINLSLGSASANPYAASSVACNNAMLAGVITVVANGNAGPNLSTLGTPAVSPLAISVGASSTSIELDLYNMSIGKSNIEGQSLCRTFESKVTDISDLEIVDCGLGRTEDFSGKDVKDKIAFIERGEIGFDIKIENAKKAGAKIVMIYNNVPGEIGIYRGESNKFIPGISLSQEEAAIIKEELKNGNNKINIKVDGKTQTQKDLLADFSSRGPSPESYDIKPDVTAPGVDIFSTYPEFINDTDPNKDNYEIAYSRISGTSMAAPHVAGVSALIKQSNEEYDPFDVKVALMNSSEDLAKKYGVNEVGAGRINAYDAATSGISIRAKQNSPSLDNDKEIINLEHETGSISFGSLNLGDKTVSKDVDLLIENRTNKTNSFNVSVEYVEPTEGNGASDAIKNGVKLNIKQTAIASKKKETSIKASVSVPKNAKPGIYQGYIKLESNRNKNETYQIPFSVKVTNPGSSDLLLLKKGMSTDKYNRFQSDRIKGFIEFRSPMKYLHTIVKDGNTGEVVGYVSSQNVSNAPTDVRLSTGSILTQSATVYPYENGEFKPYLQDLKDGLYEVEFILEGKDEKIYKTSEHFVIDNAPPNSDLKLNGEMLPKGSRIIEVKDDMLTIEKDQFGVEHEAAWIHGNITDSSVEILKDAGKDYLPIENRKITQGDNIVEYRLNGSPFIGGSIKADENGDFKFGVTKDDLKATGYESLRMVQTDIAGSIDDRVGEKVITFVEEGYPYIQGTYDKEELNLGDETVLSLDLNNAKDFIGATMIGNKAKGVDIRFELHESIRDDYEISYKEMNYPGFNDLEVQLKPKTDNPKPINGDMKDFIKVYMKVTNADNASEVYQANMFILDMKFTDKANNKIQGQMAVPDILINSESTMLGSIKAEALVKSNVFVDPNKHDLKIKIKDSNNNEYEAQYKNGYSAGYVEFEANGLPLDEDRLEAVIEAPGHFPIKFKMASTKQLFNKTTSRVMLVDSDFTEASLAGDVNRDNVIDIDDALEIQKIYGQEYKNTDKIQADLNQDGKVDNKDMYHVITNFGKINYQAEESKTPNADKQMLDKILNDIGYTNPF